MVLEAREEREEVRKEGRGRGSGGREGGAGSAKSGCPEDEDKRGVWKTSIRPLR